jgi:hypothetical protein
MTERSEIMTLNLLPHPRPYVWSIRANWPVTEEGLYYDPTSGEMFSVSDNPYVTYLGRLPKQYLNQPTQQELL